MKIPVVRQMTLIWRTADRPPGQTAVRQMTLIWRTTARQEQNLMVMWRLAARQMTLIWRPGARQMTLIWT